jgi:hypothetical protein
MPETTELGHIHLNSVDELIISLTRPTDIPNAQRTMQRGLIHIIWPPQATPVDPQRFPDVAAGVVRMFAGASTQLASIKALRKL